MKLHGNAPLGPKGRLTMVRRVTEEEWSLTEAAEAAGVSERTARKWVRRHREEGETGLADRSSAPGTVANRTEESRIEVIALRRVRMTGAEIAECLEMALSTVSGILRRIGLGKLSRLVPPEPANRYERARPGELIHIDVKKLVRIERGAGHKVTGRRTKHARGAGWEFVHVCVDDATPPGLRRGPGRREGEDVSRLPAPRGRLLPRPWDQGRAPHDRQRRRRSIDDPRDRLQGAEDQAHPHPPLPAADHWKAERLIRTMLGGWAYGAIYRHSTERTVALSGWLEFYNWRRPHGSLSHKPPGVRLGELKRNNVIGSYT